MPEPVFFLSYARADATFKRDRADLMQFLDDLSSKIARAVLPPPGEAPYTVESVRFFDQSSIDTGDVWTTALAEALVKCPVAVPLYTPLYFTRPACGKEFQVFLERVPQRSGASGIVPVLWTPATPPSKSIAELNYTDAAFPSQYAQVGMQQLLRLKVYADQYELALQALANRIVNAAAAGGLGPHADVEFEAVSSAWELVAASDDHSHRKGGITKTCFVFVSRAGWNWKPYADAPGSIGALAQRVSGELGLQYEELPVDATLPQKLEQTNDARVPTVLFGDPTSLLDAAYVGPMKRYDKQYFSNCAALVAWEPGSKNAVDADARWAHLRTNVFPQKIADPPPSHEWRSIFSADDLDTKTRTTIEQIRSRLMKQAMAEPPAGAPTVRRVDDPQAASEAAAVGIRTDTLSQLEGPTQ